MRVKVYSVVVGLLQTNCYIVSSNIGEEAVVIDPGGDASLILSRIEQLKLRVKMILSTHAHFDHVLGVDGLRAATGAKFFIHQKDHPILEAMRERVFLGIDVPPPPRVDGFLDEGDVVTVGDLYLKVIHTPGHSPGSISLYGGGTLFSGDTLFSGTIGRTDVPGGDHKQIVTSIRDKIMVLPDATKVYPGHGTSTTIGRERLLNPFVKEALSAPC